MKLVEVIAGYLPPTKPLRRYTIFPFLLVKIRLKLKTVRIYRQQDPRTDDHEAIVVLDEGIASAEDIDKAMKLGANHPMGPLALSDLIGNDVVLHIMNILYDETGDPKYRRPCF